MAQRWLIVRRAAPDWLFRRAGRGLTALLTLGALAASTAAYTVTAGDTLSGIASRHGTTVTALAEANGIDDPDRIYVGQQLVVPSDQPGGASGSPSAPSGRVAAETYVVQAGDTLAAIARRFGVTVADLAKANGITDPNRVYGGTLLRIGTEPPPPAGTAAAATGTHTVRAGQTLSAIAAKYGTTTSTMMELNGLRDANFIRIGQVLQVPGGAAAAWTCPVPGGTFIDDYGVAKPDGRRHEGIDMFAPKGSPILAPVGGSIRYLDGKRGGLQFYLTGDDGYVYFGSHLNAIGKPGRVAPGAVIGEVGNSGNAAYTSPHLHFEMIHGSIVDPYPTLTKYCG